MWDYSEKVIELYKKSSLNFSSSSLKSNSLSTYVEDELYEYILSNWVWKSLLSFIIWFLQIFTFEIFIFSITSKSNSIIIFLFIVNNFIFSGKEKVLWWFDIVDKSLTRLEREVLVTEVVDVDTFFMRGWKGRPHLVNIISLSLLYYWVDDSDKFIMLRICSAFSSKCNNSFIVCSEEAVKLEEIISLEGFEVIFIYFDNSLINWFKTKVYLLILIKWFSIFCFIILITLLTRDDVK